VIDDDGIFWMSFDDLIYYFSSVNVCMVRVNGIHPCPWKETRKQFYFELINNKNDNFFASSGVSPVTHSPDAVTTTTTMSQKTFSLNDFTCISSFFQLHVNEDNMTMIFTLHQQDERCVSNPSYIDMGFMILKVKTSHPIPNEYSLKREDYELMYGIGWKLNARQNQSDEVILNKGQYLIIPFSTGCKLKQYYEEHSEIVAAIEANMEKVKLSSGDDCSVPLSSNLSLSNSSSTPSQDDEPVASLSLITSVIPPPSVPVTSPVVLSYPPLPIQQPAFSGSAVPEKSDLLDFSDAIVKFTPSGVAMYTEIFHQLDNGNKCYLTKNEFSNFWKKSTGQALPLSVYRSILQKYGTTSDEKLNLPGFLEQKVDSLQDRRPVISNVKLEEIVQDEVRKFGVYNTVSSSASSSSSVQVLPPPLPSCSVPAPPLITVRSPPIKGPGDVTPPKAPETVKVASVPTFEATKGVSSSIAEDEKPLNFGRPAVLSIHSTSERYSLETSPHNESIHHLAEELLVLKYGGPPQVCDDYGRILLYELNLDYDGISVMFENIYDNKTLYIEVDFAGSKNIMTHRNSLKYNAIIKPRQRALMVHLMPKRTPNGWDSKYSIEYEFK
jgi:hypothetical protein